MRAMLPLGGFVSVLSGLTILMGSFAAGDANVAPLPHGLTVPAGFKAELVAAAPLVERPVMANFDEHGRLFVVDSSVTASWRADVADPSASFSFRRIVTELAPANTTPSDFVLRWLESFATGNHVSFVANGSVSGTVAVAPRPRVSEVLVCPWLKLTPANGCDDTCGYCRGRALDLGKAPFALTAVVAFCTVQELSEPPE